MSNTKYNIKEENSSQNELFSTIIIHYSLFIDITMTKDLLFYQRAPTHKFSDQ